MRNGKNNFYKKLRVGKEIQEAISFYNKIKYLMLKDLGKNKEYMRIERKK